MIEIKQFTRKPKINNSNPMHAYIHRFYIGYLAEKGNYVSNPKNLYEYEGYFMYYGSNIKDTHQYHFESKMDKLNFTDWLLDNKREIYYKL